MSVEEVAAKFSKHFNCSDKSLDAKLKSHFVETAKFDGKPIAAVYRRRQTKTL